MDWNAALAEAIARVCGPEDEIDESVNGDPDSMHGEEDDSGPDETSAELGWPEESGLDQGFDDHADEGDEDDDESEDDEEEQARPILNGGAAPPSEPTDPRAPLGPCMV